MHSIKKKCIFARERSKKCRPLLEEFCPHTNPMRNFLLDFHIWPSKVIPFKAEKKI